MNGGVIFRDIDVELDSLLLKELHVEIIDTILERELRVIQGSEAFSKLRCLCVMVVEINCDKRDKSLLVKDELFLVEDVLKGVKVILCVLDSQIEHVFISADLALVSHSRKLTLSLKLLSNACSQII